MATPTPTPTFSVTPTNTGTPAVTPTNTGTPAVTPTNTTTPTSTPPVTPTVTPTTTTSPTPTPSPAGYWQITDCLGKPYIVEIVGITPSVGQTYLFSFDSNVVPYGCYEITGLSYGPIVDNASSLGGPYEDCVECSGDYTGVTVNEFYEAIGTCCESGTTYPYPHPQYATAGGIAIQANAVELGGFGGLNN